MLSGSLVLNIWSPFAGCTCQSIMDFAVLQLDHGENSYTAECCGGVAISFALSFSPIAVP
jgi:hypothetical protein